MRGQLREATRSIDRVQIVSRRDPFLALDHHASALIALLIQKWEHQEEYIGIQCDIVRVQTDALLT